MRKLEHPHISALKSGILALSCFGFLLLMPALSFAQSEPPSLPGLSEPTPVDTSSNASDALPESEMDMSLEPPAIGTGAPGAQSDSKEKIRSQAFDAALQGLLPLRPEEIRKLLERFDRTQESVELPVYPPPKPELTVDTLSLDPGVAPKTILVSYGYVTTFNVVDTTGAPWPIENITWAGNFDVVEISTADTSGDGGEDASYSNILRITPQSEFAYGNISISLVGLKTPVIVSLQTSRDIVHYRFDAIIPERGPLAKTSIMEGTGIDLVAGSPELSSFLEGVIPPEAIKMSVSGVDSRTTAYQQGELVFLRTPLTLLSPGWITSATSADGMRVYAINQSPVVLLSDKGKTVRARLSDREDIFDE